MLCVSNSDKLWRELWKVLEGMMCTWASGHSSTSLPYFPMQLQGVWVPEWSMHSLDVFLKFSNWVILMTFKCLRQGHSRQEVAGQSLRINLSKVILVLCCPLYYWSQSLNLEIEPPPPNKTSLLSFAGFLFGAERGAVLSYESQSKVPIPACANLMCD